MFTIRDDMGPIETYSQVVYVKSITTMSRMLCSTVEVRRRKFALSRTGLNQERHLQNRASTYILRDTSAFRTKYTIEAMFNTRVTQYPTKENVIMKPIRGEEALSNGRCRHWDRHTVPGTNSTLTPYFRNFVRSNFTPWFLICLRTS